MSLRLQLLLLSLLTLALPWAGCQYAREMENVLRDGQQQALLATTATVASAIAARPDLIYRDPALTARFATDAGDLYVYTLGTRALLDGFDDEWSLPDSVRGTRNDGRGLNVRYVAATDETYLYLFLRVDDRKVVFEDPGSGARPSEGNGDHVWLAFATPDGSVDRLVIATSAPGLQSARRPERDEFGRRHDNLEPRVQAFWRTNSLGYQVEARVPLAMVGLRFGFEVVDVDQRGTVNSRVGTVSEPQMNPTGRVFRESPDLVAMLQQFEQPGVRLGVIDANGWQVGTVGTLSTASDTVEQGSPMVSVIYRRLLESESVPLPKRENIPGRFTGPHVENALHGKAGAAWFRLGNYGRVMLAAAAPVSGRRGVLGAVVLEQTGERLLTLRDNALVRLLNLTLIATAIAVAGTLGFAAWLSLRLLRIRRAAETALSPDGRLNIAFPGTAARDELGDLARSFATLLARLNEYTTYLRTLAGKLSHELRTPLAIVQSSLENLEHERPAPSSAPYLERAREGSARLQSILTAMSAAARTEEAIEHAERLNFDLKALLASMTAGYQTAFPERRFAGRMAQQPCEINGAPDLIAQLLDKLVDNAVDFCPPGGTIEIALEVDERQVQISVSNDGPLLPPHASERLFESMFEFRQGSDSKPHFGLGLYIVRLIAEFHSGRAAAENRADASGAVFRVTLPRNRPEGSAR
ncbi:MAG: ATP-binding protein [Steroidobacteraceae bacterium]